MTINGINSTIEQSSLAHKKLKLIEALKKEEETLPDKNSFGESNHKEQYWYIYEYLKYETFTEFCIEVGSILGKFPDCWTLFWAVTCDFDSVYKTYIGDN